jgi:alpha-L-arabinofuranosidase
VGTRALDAVSPFPRETSGNRPNGMRRDLAGKIAAPHPTFVRFPGGCLVNTGGTYGYDAGARPMGSWGYEAFRVEAARPRMALDTDERTIPQAPLRQVVTRDNRTGALVVTVVNAAAIPARTTVRLTGADVEHRARVTTLPGDRDDVHTRDTTPVTPRESRLEVESTFSYTFQPYSVTFIRIKTRSSS